MGVHVLVSMAFWHLKPLETQFLAKTFNFKHHCLSALERNAHQILFALACGQIEMQGFDETKLYR